MIEADNITPLSKGPLGIGAARIDGVPECHNTGGAVMASSG